MGDSKNLPESISHKQLSYLLNDAIKDKSPNDTEIDSLNKEREDFQETLNNWKKATKALLKNVSSKDSNFLKNKTPNSLMALGAMEVHLNMSLQALISFKDDKSND